MSTGRLRITCCVPYCRRTYRNDEGFAEWICGDHWRAVPKDQRRAWARLRRRRRRGMPMAPERGARLWARLKRAAIEAALGIG